MVGGECQNPSTISAGVTRGWSRPQTQIEIEKKSLPSFLPQKKPLYIFHQHTLPKNKTHIPRPLHQRLHIPALLLQRRAPHLQPPHPQQPSHTEPRTTASQPQSAHLRHEAGGGPDGQRPAAEGGGEGAVGGGSTGSKVEGRAAATAPAAAAAALVVERRGAPDEGRGPPTAGGRGGGGGRGEGGGVCGAGVGLGGC